jgi:hypothetical protein
MRKLLPLLVFFAMAATASAQEVSVSGQVSVNLLSIEGLVVGQTVTVDADFGAEHGLDVPAPFKVLIPTSGDEQQLVLYAPNGAGGPFFKMTFATKDDQVIENIQFVPMNLGGATADDRMQVITDLLTDQAWAMIVADYPENIQDGVRATTVAGYDAVELVGRYMDPEQGLVYTRLVGIPNSDPSNPNGVMVVANIIAKVLELSGPEDLPRTRGGVALEHFEWLE